jgi:lysophospholipase L1-like esterase
MGGINMTVPLFEVCTTGLLGAGLLAPSWGQTPLLQKVSAPPSLTPLTMSVGGRVLTTPSTSLNQFGSEEYVSQWPGSYFKAAFKGTELYFGVGVSHEILSVVLDGRTVRLVAPEVGVYRLSGLENRPHTVRVFVVTEALSAPNHFGGFAISSGEKAVTPAKNDRQIEFIGDSHTVGYGNTSSNRECTSDEVWAKTDNTQAFGPLTADLYHADYQVNAITGRGIVRNYNGTAGDPIPEAYRYVLFDKKQVYSAPAWKPQIIVIGLGTNDFSTALHPGETWKTRDELHSDYETTYVRFIQGLRARDRYAYIILWATDSANGEIESEVQKVIEQVKSQGEVKIGFIPVDHLSFSGCHSHPSLADETVIQDKLVQFIDASPQIWQGK